MFFLHRIWNWCSRFRHRCGYGVHSPSDFFLITSVVYEKYHYYAYRVLKERGFPAYLPHYRRKVNRLLFRLAFILQWKTLRCNRSWCGFNCCISSIIVRMANSLWTVDFSW